MTAITHAPQHAYQDLNSISNVGYCIEIKSIAKYLQIELELFMLEELL